MRQIILEAKFTPKRPLDRDAMQIALGTHPMQLQRVETERELRSHPYYEEGKKDLYSFIDENADPSWDVNPGEHIDTVVDNATGFLGALFSEYNHDGRLGSNVADITRQHVEMMLEDLLNDEYVTVNVNDIVVPTPKGDKWYWTV